MYGAALTTGSTVADRAGASGTAARRHRRAGARRRAALSRQAPFGHRLSGQGRRRARRKNREQASRLRRRGDALTFGAAGPAPAASKIEPIVSPGGIKAWLVREPSVPMVALDFAFTGGANADPAGQAGRRQHGVLDARRGRGRSRRARVPGAHGGEGDRARLHGRRAISFRGSLRSLSVNLDEAVNLLRLALTAPRFDTEPVERIRNQMLAELEPRAAPIRTRSPTGAGGRRRFRIIPMAGLRRARRTRSPPSRPTT